MELIQKVIKREGRELNEKVARGGVSIPTLSYIIALSGISYKGANLAK